jgi:hypothetical protein
LKERAEVVAHHPVARGAGTLNLHVVAGAPEDDIAGADGVVAGAGKDGDAVELTEEEAPPRGWCP